MVMVMAIDCDGEYENDECDGVLLVMEMVMVMVKILVEYNFDKFLMTEHHDVIHLHPHPHQISNGHRNRHYDGNQYKEKPTHQRK